MTMTRQAKRVTAASNELAGNRLVGNENFTSMQKTEQGSTEPTRQAKEQSQVGQS